MVEVSNKEVLPQEGGLPAHQGWDAAPGGMQISGGSKEYDLGEHD